jgi:hypothetical protein
MKPVLCSVWFGFMTVLVMPCQAKPDSLQRADFRLTENFRPSEGTSLFDVAWAPAGLCLLSVDLLRDSAKYGLQTLIRQPFNGYETELDDYIQYAPVVLMYTFDMWNVKARHDAWNQTKLLAMSELGTTALVQLLKYTLKIQRPNNGAYNSYPSGHTSQAFVASQVFYNEYKSTSRALALSGHLFSVSTGMLRIVNNRHWVPDVLLGAGIAMLVTNLVYYYEPLKNWNPFPKKNRKTEMGFVPQWNDNYMGGYLTLKF